MQENLKGKTPIEVFYEEHKHLVEEIKQSAKGITDSGMIVAILVCTVTFCCILHYSR